MLRQSIKLGLKVLMKTTKLTNQFFASCPTGLEEALFNELKELFLQIAVYCGVPTGVECFKHAEEFFKLSDIDINEEIS